MPIDYAQVIEANAADLAGVAGRHPLSTEVPSCPGWDLERLLAHVGRVFAWATEALTGGGAPPERPPAPPEGAAVVPWFQDTAATLVGAARTVAPTAPAWNFAGAPATAAFWSRRQAIESTVHRWDGLHAAGEPAPIDAALAVDGIGEFLDVLAPYAFGRRDGTDIGGSLHLHTTDAQGEWTVRTDDGVLRVTEGHAKGDVAVRGPAEQLLLVVWQRRAPDAEGIEVFGDRAVLDRWLELGAL